VPNRMEPMPKHFEVATGGARCCLCFHAFGGGGTVWLMVVVGALVMLGQTQPSASLAQQDTGACGWIGAQVRPITREFALSLGMVEPYGAIFRQPEPGSPAANGGIAEGDVVTAINGSPLRRASDLEAIISKISPGSLVYLTTFRNRQLMEPRLMLGAAACLPANEGVD
jgi:hypothetical protein